MARGLFPERLWRLASDPGPGSSALSWSRDGRALSLEPAALDALLGSDRSPFRSSRSATLRRQLILYGFRRGEPMRRAEDETVYWHPMFRRGRPELLPLVSKLQKRERRGGAALRAARDRLRSALDDAYRRFESEREPSIFDSLRNSFDFRISDDCSQYIEEQFNKYGSRLFKDEIDDESQTRAAAVERTASGLRAVHRL